MKNTKLHEEFPLARKVVAVTQIYISNVAKMEGRDMRSCFETSSWVFSLFISSCFVPPTASFRGRLKIAADGDVEQQARGQHAGQQ